MVEAHRFKRRYSFKRQNITDFIGKVLDKRKREVISENLKRARGPLGLTPESYILVKLGFFCFALIYAFFTKMKGPQSLVFILFSIFVIDIYIYFIKKDREKAFKNEMPEIVDVFELGAAANIPLEDIFLLAASFSDKKHVKGELAKLSAEYYITRDKEGCLKRFSKNIGLPEVDILSMSLLQGERTGKNIEILSSLSKSLYNTAIAKVARQDKLTDYKVLAAIFTYGFRFALVYVSLFYKCRGGN